MFKSIALQISMAQLVSLGFGEREISVLAVDECLPIPAIKPDTPVCKNHHWRRTKSRKLVCTCGAVKGIH